VVPDLATTLPMSPKRKMLTPENWTSVSYVVAAVPVPDFAISAFPSSQSVAAGGSVSYGVSVAASNGFTGDIGLSVTGLPSGTSATFTPVTVAAPGSSTLDITSITSTPTGSYTLVVSGTAADGTTRSTTATYTVTAAVIPDFTLDVSPKSRVITKKTSTSYTATIAARGGFSGVVTFAVAGLPAGATASFSPPTVTTVGTSKLTLTTSSSSPIGQYKLQITASSGSLSRTATAALTIK